MGRVAFGCVADAVVELGHIARATWQLANGFTEALEAAALFGNGHGKQGFAFLAHFGAFGDEAQAVEVHVGTTQDGGVGFALGLVGGHILFDGGHGQRSGGLDNAAGVDKHVLDGGTDGVGVHRHELINQAACDTEGFFPHQLDSCAIGEQTHIGQGDTFFGADGLDHRVRVVHLHPNHLHLGAHRLDVIGNPGNQPAAANGDKHGVQRALVLAQDFHRNRALAGNHVRVVERVHKRQALLFLECGGMGVGVGITVAKQHHLATKGFYRVHLELGRGGGHDHHGAGAQCVGAHGHALRMVARRGADHAFFQLGRAELHHLVVRPAQLEAEHRLLVFALEQHLVVQAAAQVLGQCQVGLHRHVIDTRGEDFFEVVGGGEVFGHGRGR